MQLFKVMMKITFQKAMKEQSKEMAMQLISEVENKPD